MSNKKKTIWNIIISVISVVVISGIVMTKRFNAIEHERMVKVAKENKHLIYDEFLSDVDGYHKVKSVEIDYSKLSRNPKGGIKVHGYINKDKTLSFDTVFDSPNGDGSDIRLGVTTYSKKLGNFLSNI
jgi:hypothetical protein